MDGYIMGRMCGPIEFYDKFKHSAEYWLNGPVTERYLGAILA